MPQPSSRNRFLLATALMLLMVIAYPLLSPEGPLHAENFHSRSAQNGERLLVLVGGKVLKGQISTVPGGYAVDLTSGRIAIPYADIICEAATLREAYRKQRDAISKPSASLHIQLANWCIQQKLYVEAEEELNAALKLQPNHHVARRLIQQLSQRKPEAADFVDAEGKEHFEKLLIKREFSTAEPIGGIHPDLALEFASKIEPLLINSCANSSCHAEKSDREFRLIHKWGLRGNTRHITDQNLDAVLKQIDLTHPEQSPLLMVLDGKHGARNTDVFAGARAAEHRRTLQVWTLRVARFLGPPASAITENPLQQASHQQTDTMNSSDTSIQQTAGQLPLQTLRSPLPFHPTGQETEMQPEKNRVEDIRQEQAPDPFDPGVFNRLKHGRK